MRNTFDVELKYIHDEKMRKIAQKLIDLLPDYFFEVPASSTGKYHPKCCGVEHGLVRHTKIAVRIAHELLNNQVLFNNFSEHEQDLIIIALLVHDGFKHGLTKEKYVRFDHPLIVANFIKDKKEEIGLSDEDAELLYTIISSHMGIYNTSPYSDVTLPIPKTAMQKFVHMCDDLASKKFLNIEFENDNIVP